VAEVLAQPFRLRFQAGHGHGEHIPDFLAVFRDGSRRLLDVRPAGLVEDKDAVKFAAAGEAALAAGWRYSVVAGWRPHALSVVDALSAQRRPLQDPLGLQGQLLGAARDGARSFRELAAGTSLPAVARAHALHQLYTYLEEHPNPRRPERLHELSHGEGFLEILRTRVSETGFYLMDEPDAPLSFTVSLGLAALLHDLAAAGGQAVVATHSPVVAAVPGANLLELGAWGIRPASWEDLSLVVSWRQFMRDPQAFFRHLF
jgi:hypothetical protein